MSDLTKTRDNFLSLLEGKTDFNGFLADEGSLIEKDIAGANVAVQPFLNIAYSSFKAGASTLVGAGESAIGTIIATSSDTQATMLLNAMQAVGIPTVGPLNMAEHAALVTLINGFKTMLDRMHLQYAAPTAPAALAPPQ
jgi:hypothetical protein